MSQHSSLQNILARRPLGLAFDFDGTLSSVAPTSEAAILYPGASALLEEAARHDGVHVAIMTGRAIEDGAAKINLDGLSYIGTHGLEWSEGLPWLHRVHIPQDALVYAEPGKMLLDLVEQHLSELPGVIVQRKRIGGSIHYRLSEQPETIRRKLIELLEEPATRLHMSLSENKRIVEIRPPLPINKGTALRQFAERHALNGIIFAGDDRTDLDAVLEIARLREAGVDALAVVVQHEDTLPELIQHADRVVQGVAGMVELLKEMVACL